MRLLGSETPENGLTAKFDRKNRFVIKKYKAKNGLFIYLLSNNSNNDRLTIPHYLMDRFRTFLTHLSESLTEAAALNREINQKLYFKDVECYRFQYSASTLGGLIVIDSRNSRQFHIALEAIGTLITLLYDPRLDHPNGTFDRIIDYHQLFQFTFNEGSESITSGLSIRRDILIDEDNYVPLEKNNRDRIISITTNLEALKESLEEIESKAPKNTADKASGYKRKLGERSTDQNYTVDYDALFGSSPQHKPVQAVKTESLAGKVTATSCPVPLLAIDIKAHAVSAYKCELSQEDASALREGLLADRDAENLLGFEILTAIYKKNGKLKSFRFPLYYMNVKVEESGRYLHIHPPRNGDVYLNHLSLAAFVERFHSAKKGNPLEIFFNTLLSQKIEIDKKLQNISIHRQLPYSEEVFRQTREILIGRQGENGKGGIIENLEILGIECDLDSVILYKAARNPSPLTRALDQDLKNIQRTAHESPNRFYASLLGQFLNPELKSTPADGNPFCSAALAPGTLTKSSKALMDTLNHHNLVLLEGPPGTGKTFTIRNLLIHCLNTDKRLLIVSDQQAAIQALTEKLEEYLVGLDVSTPAAKSTLNLWKSAIKVIDEVPQHTDTLNTWVGKLAKMLQMELSREQDWPEENPGILKSIQQLDVEYDSIRGQIGQILHQSLDTTVGKSFVTPKHLHPCTNDDIADLREFLIFIGAGEHSRIKKTDTYLRHQALARQFVHLRSGLLNGPLAECYGDFQVNHGDISHLTAFVSAQIELLRKLIREKPKTRQALRDLFEFDTDSTIGAFLVKNWESEFDPSIKRGVLQSIKALFIHPCLKTWRPLLAALEHQHEFIAAVEHTEHPQRVLRQFQKIHLSLDPACKLVEHCLALELCLAVDRHYPHSSIQEHLQALEYIQKQRDKLIKEMCLLKLAGISKNLIATRRNATSRATRITSILETLKTCNSIDSGSGVPVLRELQETLWESFPIWICRKQAVSFLFPSHENMIDLVIVDEAGQCRVDDALPLLYRAKKLMVVGDDRQTVIDKNSVIDDYLFKEFELEEHLRNIQARGVKGGGSNLFELVKSIKQGGVLLDEHYRCPPSIIAYSNQYVYNYDLKVMQWQLPHAPPSVVVDYSEKFASSNKKEKSGKYKGIETEMIDRFFSYVAKTISRIEHETSQRINLETDVALCYFLLKNEPYVKDQKSKFLRKLERGNDVLDGAGAALQGKERKYIFYLWDINRTNVAYFRQGDDPDKRRGELNVLMSRPKVRAYHYLHKGFEALRHESATITDYLWKTYQSQHEQRTNIRSEFSNTASGINQISRQRSSGQSMYAMLSYLWEHRGIEFDKVYEPHFNIVIGNPKQKVDFMAIPRNGAATRSIAVVDLSAFTGPEDLIDYYFQLQRATPAVEPVFAFLHELADDRSNSYRLIERKIN